MARKWFFDEPKIARPATDKELEDASTEEYDEYIELTSEMIAKLEAGEVLTVDGFPDVYNVYLRLKK